MVPEPAFAPPASTIGSRSGDARYRTSSTEAELALVDHRAGTVLGHRREAGERADVLLDVGVADRDERRLDRLGLEVHATVEDARQLHGLLGLQGADHGALLAKLIGVLTSVRCVPLA